jgi:hypothetical protein
MRRVAALRLAGGTCQDLARACTLVHRPRFPAPQPTGASSMVLKRVGVLSVGKIMGAIYAVIGLLAGGLLALFGILGASLGGSQGALPGAGLGLAAIVLCPLIYGVLGFIGGLIVAALYNVLAGVMGGIELDLQQP